MDYKVIDRVGDCRFVHGLQHSEKTSISEGIHLPTGVKVRLKTVRGANMEDFERGQELFREATILARLSHPNIIHIYHLIKHVDVRILVTEWINGLSLDNYIRLFFHRALPESIARLYCRQLVSAIIAMQMKRILLREIPVNSLIVTKDFRNIKITDLSSALVLPIRKEVTSASCSPEFTAPEIIEENIDLIGPEAVSWTLGIVLFYMLVGELPFQSPYFDHKRRGRLLRFAQRGLTPNHISAISEFSPGVKTCQLLLRQLIEPRAIIRIPICELCTNSWITDSGTMPFQPFSPCSAHFFANLEAVSKMTPSTSCKGSSMNGKDQSSGKWEVPANRGLLNRIKAIFSHSNDSKRSEEDVEDNTRGNEWLLEGETETNIINLHLDSTDSLGAFGEKKCNSIIEALDYLASVKKTSCSEVARSILERPIGAHSAAFQILLNLHRQNSGVYLLDHTVPGWPLLASGSFMAFMDPVMLKRLRVKTSDVGTTSESIVPSGELQDVYWWWCPILLKNLGNCICSGQGEVFQGTRLDRRAFRRELMVSIEAFERKMLNQSPSQAKTDTATSLMSCKTLDSRRPKQMKSKHSINAFGVVVMRKPYQLQNPEDSSRLVREFTERLHRIFKSPALIKSSGPPLLNSILCIYESQNMSHAGDDIGENSSPMQAWNRTPGKPNFPNLPSAASWGGKKKSNSNPVDSTTNNDVWPLLSDSSLGRKNEPSQWPTPAELAGTGRGDSLNDFTLANSWNPPGTSLALRSLTESDDRTDPWPPVDAVAHSSSSHPSIDLSVSRTISTSGDNAFTSQRQRVQSMTKPRNESFSSWGSPTDGDFSAFANQPLPSTSENKLSNQQTPGEGICSSVSDSGNHSEGQNESLIHALINSKECWGRRPIDQTTPWDLSALNEELVSVVNTVAGVTAAPTANSNSNQSLLGDAVSLSAAARQRRGVMKPGNVPVAVPSESNVWSSEPPNGTGIWEMHYEGSGQGEGRTTNRWKTPGGSSVVPSLNSPPGSHRLVPPSSSFMNPPAVPQQQPTTAATRGFQNNAFFQTSGPQPQQRLGQPATGGQQPPPGTGRGPPNGMFGPGPSSAFKSQGIPQASGWPPLSLTPDNQSPMEDAKRFLVPSGPWGSNDRVLGKPQQQTNQQLPPSLGGGEGMPRWPSPSIDTLSHAGISGWGQQQQDIRSHKFVPWSQSQTVAAPPQRFHLRQQNTSNSSGVVPSSAASTQQQQPPLRLLGPSQQQQNHHLQQQSNSMATFLRTEVARQLMLLGFHDEAGVLISDSSGYEDVEKFLYDLRDSTGCMNPGLNQLISNVTAYLMSSGVNDFQSSMGGGIPQPPPFPPFDLFDNRLGGGSGGFHMGKIQPPPPLPSNFPNRQNPSEVLSQLFMRESHLQATIFQLDKKKRELSMKHSQIRKMNMGGPTSHHSSSMLQELIMQQAQISQQIEAHETQLGQVRLQIACLSRIASGGGGNGGGINNDSNAAVAAAAMLMRLRGGGPGGPGAPFQPNRMMGGGGNNNTLAGAAYGGGGLMMNASSPSADLAPRLADLKLSMDMNRRMPWEGGGGIWDLPTQQQYGGHGPDFQSPDIWNTSWLLLSDISPQFSPEVLRITISNALDQHSGGVDNSGTFEIHTCLPNRYVLVGFLNPSYAAIVSNSSTIKNQANSVIIIPPAEALNKLQEIKALGEDQTQSEQVVTQQDNQQSTTSVANWPPQTER
nr:cell wall protein awa1p [Hymenolepis microstoma]